MRCVRLLALAIALTFGITVLASAQESARAGITLGSPGDIGILWHVSDAIAVRPAFSFSHSSGDSVAGGSSGGWDTGLALSALFYVKKYDKVRTYVSPQYSYSYSSVTTTPASTQGSLPSITGTTNTNAGAGAFGAQYTPTAHFALYGETGIGFSRHRSELGAIVGRSAITSSTWGPFAGVGVVFYP
jgi:hypothetical protein